MSAQPLPLDLAALANYLEGQGYWTSEHQLQWSHNRHHYSAGGLIVGCNPDVDLVIERITNVWTINIWPKLDDVHIVQDLSVYISIDPAEPDAIEKVETILQRLSLAKGDDFRKTLLELQCLASP